MLQFTKLKILFTLLSIILKFNILFAQDSLPVNYFRSPVASKFIVTSNFGEIRPNHFHTGFDIFTNRRSGENIYAVADGYISRIKIKASGYGNALYITHPNGYVSVYAHLSKFKKEIEDYVFKIQHEKEEFALNLYPLPDMFKVKKGEVVAKSGNTGTSFGAHLHFEIREELSEDPINLFLLGYKVKDDISPKIFSIYAYNIDNGKIIRRNSFKYYKGQTIKVFGKIAFGIEAYDFLNDRRKPTGLYNVEIHVDDSLIFSYKLDKISFYENRYLNSFIDYYLRKKTGKKVSKCFIEPNNKLSIYEDSTKTGIYNFSDNKLHKIKLIAKDIYDNKTILKFNIKSDSLFKIDRAKENNIQTKIHCKKKNFFYTDKIKLIFHLNTIYRDIKLNYYTSKNKYSKYSDLHHVHNPFVPVHNKISIAIKTKKLNNSLKNKALIAELKPHGRIKGIGGEWNGGFVEAKIKNFGIFFVTIDTISPKIKIVNFNSRNKSNKIIKFKIYDNLSGIDTYNGYVDNKWVLFKYDKKNDLIYCNLYKEGLKKGKHNLKLVIEDFKGNKKIFKSYFIF